MKTDLQYYVKSIITIVLLTDPLVRPMLFKSMTAHEPERRRGYVWTITLVVAVTLGLAALGGREILDLLGINLNAFGIAGGLGRRGDDRGASVRRSRRGAAPDRLPVALQVPQPLRADDESGHEVRWPLRRDDRDPADPQRDQGLFRLERRSHVFDWTGRRW